MSALSLARATSATAPDAHLDLVARVLLAGLSLLAGLAPIAARWIPDSATRTAVGAALVVVYFAFAYAAKRRPALQPFWCLPLAFGVFALVWLLNNTVPGFVSASAPARRAQCGQSVCLDGLRHCRRPVG